VRVWEADPVFTAARIFSSPRVFVLLSLGASAHFLFPSARFSFPRLSAWIHSAPGSFFAFFFCHPRRSARASCLPILVCRSSAGVESVFPARWIHVPAPAAVFQATGPPPVRDSVWCLVPLVESSGSAAAQATASRRDSIFLLARFGFAQASYWHWLPVFLPTLATCPH
jgi:hypothetical protein